MDYAITEDINKIIRIKNDLNEVLRENGIEGGLVFEDYPDKFRQLFRILEGYSEDVVDKNEYSGGIDTIVAEPEITWFENVVTITCATEGATIYYMVKSASGNNDRGYGPYEKQFYIKEDVYVEAYAQYNELKSSTAWANVPFYAGMTPNIPKIDRDDTTITITCEGTYTSIWWSTINGNYVEYTGPVTVARTKDVYAFSTYNRFASDIAFLKAPEQPVIPEIPVITPGINSFTITCETPGADIYYMNRNTFLWVLYSGEVEINQSGYYRTKSVLGNYESYPSEYVWIEYVVAPLAPVVSYNNNTVIIGQEPGEEPGTIYYTLGDDETIHIYENPVIITEDTSITAWVERNGRSSTEVTMNLDYEEPSYNTPNPPSITCLNNVVIMSSVDGGTIWYRKEGESSFVEYMGPFTITETAIYHAYVTNNGLTSTTTSVLCTYVESGGTTVEAPDIDCINNKVYITTLTEGATIYYKTESDEYYGIYNGPIDITSTTTFMAYALKDNVQSDITVEECVFDPYSNIPAAPVITCINNRVTMTTTTYGAIIYYKREGDAEFTLYNNTAIIISEDTTFIAFSYKNGYSSTNVTYDAIYEGYRLDGFEITTEEINTYLTFEFLDDGNIKFMVDVGEILLNYPNAGQDGNFDYTILQNMIYPIYCRKNSGDWTKVTPAVINDSHAEVSISVSSNDIVQFKGDNNWYGRNDRATHHLYTDTQCYVYGNLLSCTKTWMIPNTDQGDVGFSLRLFLANNKTMYNHPSKDIVIPAVIGRSGGFPGHPLEIFTPNGETFTHTFFNCNKLTRTPKIDTNFNSVSDLKWDAFNMRYTFQNCYSITTALFNIWSEHIDGAYGLFYNCTNLNRAPIIYSTRWYHSVGGNMFYNCTRLGYLEVYSIKYISAYDKSDNIITNWYTEIFRDNAFLNVRPVGTVMIRKGTTHNGLPKDWSVIEKENIYS